MCWNAGDPDGGPDAEIGVDEIRLRQAVTRLIFTFGDVKLGRPSPRGSARFFV